VGDWTTVLWRGFDTGRRTISIPRLIEARGDDLRRRYLAWIYELGNVTIDGRRVIDHLELSEGFSYWWMAPLAHTPNFYESPQISDAIKSLVFEDEMRAAEGRPARVILHSANRALAAVVGDFCQQQNIAFEDRPIGDRTARRSAGLRSSHVGAAGFLLLLASRRLRAGAARASSSAIAIFDMLIHLQPATLDSGRFQSKYWQGLPDILSAAGIRSSWVHTFFGHREVPSFGAARQLTLRFTATARGREHHSLIDAGLGWRGALEAIADYRKLARARHRLANLRAHFSPASSRLNFWPLLADSWTDSLSGLVAMQNCCRLALYKGVLAAMPRQIAGLYILENQPWEMALLHMWRRFGHGAIVGAPHATVRFWDLRYFYDPRTYETHGRNDLPRPDAVAVNGPAARAEYLAAGYPPAEVADVESLRYLHLASEPFVRRPAADDGVTRVLLCGDNIPGANARLMEVVLAADAQLERRARYVFKPHKAEPFDPAPYRALDLRVESTAELNELLAACDMVVTGNTTTAAVDAYCLGVPVAMMADGSILNASPFRGVAGVTSFTDAPALAAAIEGRGALAMTASTNAFFHLDPMLPRWRRLLTQIGVPLSGGSATS